MTNKFDVLNYMNILKNIKKDFNNLKNDNTNEELYLNLKKSLNKLNDLIVKRLIPSDLIYKSEKVYYDYYRLMEVTYKKDLKKK